jgi:hypothetical protein
MNTLFVNMQDEFATQHKETMGYQEPAIGTGLVLNAAFPVCEVACWQEPSIPEEAFSEEGCDGY